MYEHLHVYSYIKLIFFFHIFLKLKKCGISITGLKLNCWKILDSEEFYVSLIECKLFELSIIMH